MEFFLSAFVTLTVVIDPLGTAAVYAALTATHTPAQAQNIAKRASVLGTFILVFFGFAGAFILKNLGITLDAFRIAGGLLLFVTAFRMLMGHHDQNNLQKDSSVYRGGSDIAIFPLAIPLLSGPGCMTATILLMNKSPDLAHQLTVYAAIITSGALAYIAMRGAAQLAKLLGHGGIQITERLMGILLAALAVQFIADGAAGLIKHIG